MAVRRSVAWMAGGQGAFFILQFLGSVVVARLLSPYDVGVFAIAVAVVGIVGVIQAIGLNSYIVRERNLTPQIVSTVGTVNILLAVGMSITVALLGFIGEHLFRERGVREVLFVIAMVPVIGSFALVPSAMLERENNFRILALIRAGSTAIGLGITITLAMQGFRYMSFAYSQIATAIITNLVLMTIARRHLNYRPSLVGFRPIAKFGIQMLAVSGLSIAASRLSEVMLGRLQGLAALGLYSRASGNHNMLWDSVHGIVGRVIFVDFANHAATGAPLRDRYVKVLETMTGLLWPIFGGVAVLAGPIVRIVYGDSWIGAATPLALLCVASMVLVSIAMSGEVFVISHQTKRQVRIEFLRTAIGTTLFIGACLHSLEAAAAARIADALFVQYLYRPHLVEMVGAQKGDFRSVYRRSAIVTCAAVTPALVLMIANSFSTSIPFYQLASVILGGGLLWLVALKGTQHFLFPELVNLLARLYRKTQVA